MEKNDVLEICAEALGTNAEGIAHVGGVTLFVPRLLPGERATVRILKVQGNIAYGKVEEVLIPAEERLRPHCPVFGKCGGCQLQHMRYYAQVRWKRDFVRSTLKKIAGITARVERCIRSEHEYGYRNKLQLPIGRLNGENAIGFYAERTHRIVPTQTCPLHPDWADRLIAALHRFMETCGLDGYDETAGTGQLRHLIVREVRGKFLVVLVTTVREIKGIDYFDFLLGEIFSEYSLFLCVHTGKDNVIFGSEPVLLHGKASYEGTECGITFEAGAGTFLQVNEGVRGKLYDDAASAVSEGETVIDCYSGGGLLTALFAQKCLRAYGIEVVKEATACAKRLAERNKLSGKMFPICGKVEEELPPLLEREKDATVVLDPPRAGVSREVLKTILLHGVKKIILISCNPASFARDLGILTGFLAETENGELKKCEISDPMYQIEKIQPFDMFPQTRHVETLAVLTRRETVK